MAPRKDQPGTDWRKIAENDLEDPDVLQGLAENPSVEDLSPELQVVVRDTEKDLVDLDLG